MLKNTLHELLDKPLDVVPAIVDHQDLPDNQAEMVEMVLMDKSEN